MTTHNVKFTILQLIKVTFQSGLKGLLKKSTENLRTETGDLQPSRKRSRNRKKIITSSSSIYGNEEFSSACSVIDPSISLIYCTCFKSQGGRRQSQKEQSSWKWAAVERTEEQLDEERRKKNFNGLHYWKSAFHKMSQKAGKESEKWLLTSAV